MDSELDSELIGRLVLSGWGLDAQVARLDGERDSNWLLTARDRSGYVLKVFSPAESPQFAAAEVAVQQRLRAAGLPVPEVITGLDGHALRVVEDAAGRPRLARIVKKLPGRPLATERLLSKAFWNRYGGVVARLTNALAGFDHPAIRRPFHWDLALVGAAIGEGLERVAETGLRQVIGALYREYRSAFERWGGGLTCSAVHGDLNDHNVLVGRCFGPDGEEAEVTGLIDFGDMVWSHTINDLAVAVAYAVLDRDDPLACAAEMVRGYAQFRALAEGEADLLWHLARMRLAQSAVIAARQTAEIPGNTYLSVSQAMVQRTLPRLAGIPAGLAAAVFRKVAGLEEPREVRSAAAWIDQGRLKNPEAPVRAVLDLPPGEVRTVRLDWSVTSAGIEGDPDGDGFRTVDRGEVRETAGLNAPVAIGIGAWGEPRLVYQTPQFSPDQWCQQRTIHLGLDLFAPAETGVRALADGTVHDCANIDLPGDYGGVVVLCHECPGMTPVYVLFGHLDPGSISGLKKGQQVVAGEVVGRLGDRSVNGGWEPHLHLQVLADDFGLGCQFPGVAAAEWQEVWLRFSPNPAALLGLSPQEFDGRPAATDDLVRRRRGSLGGSVRLSYREPLHLVRGWRQYLFDSAGRRYLDAYNNVPHVGHAHPAVVEAVTQQMRLLNSNTRYVSALQAEFAERLLATFPRELDRCFLLSSASEANELALRLARAATGGRDMIVLEGAYHGHTTTLTDLSPYKHLGPGGGGTPEWVQVAEVPDVYRGRYQGSDPLAGNKYAADVRRAAREIDGRGGRLAGFVAETCPSVAGQLIPPPGYLPQVYAIVREQGGVCIADEVQTGYGRMGDGFYAFESQGVVPDIVVLGKPIGNGFPLAAVITRRGIAEAFDNGMEFFSTFGGSHVSCAAGLAVLETVQREGLQEHARHVGQHIASLLGNRLGAIPLVGDIRGRGLYWGIELVCDRQSKAPARAAADWVCNQLRAQGILIGTDGVHHNVLKIRPPMPFTAADAERLAGALEDVLRVADSIQRD